MADAGNALSLLAGERGHEGTRPGKEHPPPHAALHGGEDMRRQHRGGAAAARAAGVHVLGQQVVNQHPAVEVFEPRRQPFPLQKVLQNVMSDSPEIPREDRVIIPEIPTTMTQEILLSPEALEKRRRIVELEFKIFMVE